MTETVLQVQAVCKLVWVASYAALYGFGGISGKWKRRFVGSAWAMLGVFGFSMWQECWHPVLLLYLPMLIGASSLGYGASGSLTKVKRRAISGLAYGVSALPIAWYYGTWATFTLHIILCTVISIVLGAFQVVRGTRNEETLIGATGVTLPLYMVCPV